VEDLTPWRVGFVPGVSPGKWERSWTEHERVSGRRRPLELRPVPLADQERLVRSGELDMCLVRLPVDRDGLHLVTLYEEVPVAVVAQDHPVAAFEEVSLSDLDGELDVLAEFSDLDLPMAVETVAAGSGYVLVPMSLARLHHRKDVTFRPVTDAEGSSVGLAWLVANEDPDTQRFVGVVRGRRPGSSRG
jgi:DNA-binding transcriptional LysR family regulator